MPLNKRKRTHGFTLVEMLTVVAIISILAGLLGIAAIKAFTTTKEKRIANEINQLTMAMENFKNKYDDYPPSDLRNIESDASNINKFIRRAFYRYADGKSDDDIKADVLTRLNAISGASDTDITAYDPAKALVFWLSGFSPDPTAPFTGGGTKTALFEFPTERLIDGKFLSPGKNLFTDDGDNVWEVGELYKVQKAYLYIDRRAYTTSYTYITGTNFRTYQGVRANSYHIISSGLDDLYGIGSQTNNSLSYPQGPFTGTDADNVTNFSNNSNLRDATDE